MEKHKLFNASLKKIMIDKTDMNNILNTSPADFKQPGHLRIQESVSIQVSDNQDLPQIIYAKQAIIEQHIPSYTLASCFQWFNSLKAGPPQLVSCDYAQRNFDLGESDMLLFGNRQVMGHKNKIGSYSWMKRHKNLHYVKILNKFLHEVASPIYQIISLLDWKKQFVINAKGRIGNLPALPWQKVAITWNYACKFHLDNFDITPSILFLYIDGGPAGDIIFPELNISFSLEMGDILFFKSNSLIHGTMITPKGTRLAIVPIISSLNNK